MLSVTDIRNKSFEKSARGYKCDEVESFLNTVAGDYDSLLRQADESEQKILKLVDRINEYREDEDAIKNALLSAQKQGMKIVVQAEQEAKQIVNNASIDSQKLVIATKEEYNDEIQKLAKLKKDVTEFKRSLTELYNKQLRLIMEIPEVDDDDIENADGSFTDEIDNSTDESAASYDVTDNTQPESENEEADKSSNEETHNDSSFDYSDIQQVTGMHIGSGYYNSQETGFTDLKFGNNLNK